MGLLVDVTVALPLDSCMIMARITRGSIGPYRRPLVSSEISWMDDLMEAMSASLSTSWSAGRLSSQSVEKDCHAEAGGKSEAGPE